MRVLHNFFCTNKIMDDITGNHLAFFKYSPITLVDIERSFSIKYQQKFTGG